MFPFLFRPSLSPSVLPLFPAMLLSPDRNSVSRPATLRGVRAPWQKRGYHFRCQREGKGCRRHSGVVDGRCRGWRRRQHDVAAAAADDDDDDEDDSSACKRITLRGGTKTANPVILFQTRRRTAASRKESKRSTTSN